LQNGDFNEIPYSPAASAFFVSGLPRFEKSSYAKQSLAFGMNWGIYTP
jgi:hypothetical protein